VTPVWLAGYDGSPSSARAVAFAERLAGATGARVVPVTVREVTGWSGRGTLGVAEVLLRGEPGGHARVVGAMSVADGLRLLAREEDASLVVVGGTHRNVVRRAVRGSVAEQLLHGASCPVLVVPDGEAPAPDVIGVAGADAVAVAEELAAALGARLVHLDGDEVVGACGREGVGLLVTPAGRAARHLADHAPCPLLLVPGGARTDLAGLSPPATA
jgi:nucleotide-binding universal stress UspA family protein